jgi:uridine phosphorylase
VAPYLRPTAPIAADVLLPTDPALALTIAQRVMVKPRMANHRHGLWGYTGEAATGGELTVQASGIGGPSAAAVLAELAGHGARRVVRLGPCTALGPGLEPGATLVVERAIGGDGVSRALQIAAPRPDPALADALADALGAGRATVASTDLAGLDGAASPAGLKDDGAAAADLETAAVLGLGERLGLAAAAVLVVTDPQDGALADSRLAEHAEAVVGALAAARDAAAGRAG